MSIKHWILGVWAMVLLGCESPHMEYRMVGCASLPSPRAAATSFVVGDYAYVFGGRDSAGTYLNDLWQYDTQNDTWTSLGKTPLKERVNATACVHDGVAYIGLGFNGRYSNSTGYLQDWWAYDPSTNTWQPLSNYPANTTARAVSMVGDGELYVGYGFCWTYERDMYCYDIAEDKWEYIDVHLDRKATTFPTRSFGGVGTTCQGRHFAGTGFRAYSLNWWGEFLPEGKWIKRKDVPGKRTTASCAATEDFIYVIGGHHFGGVNTDGKVLADIQQYNPQTDTWQYIGQLPNGGRMNHVAFSVGKRVFVGGGENENLQVCGDFYCIYEN